MLLLGERLPSADTGIALRLVAFGAAVAGAWVLAVRSAPRHAEPSRPGGWIQPTFPTAAG